MTDISAVDPVCGTRLDPARTPFTSDHEGMRYYFCSEECRRRFERDPEAYLNSGLTATDLSE